MDFFDKVNNVDMDQMAKITMVKSLNCRLFLLEMIVVNDIFGLVTHIFEYNFRGLKSEKKGISQ